MFFEIEENFEVPPEALEQFWGFYDCYLEKLEDGKVRLNKEGMYLYLPFLSSDDLKGPFHAFPIVWCKRLVSFIEQCELGAN